MLLVLLLGALAAGLYVHQTSFQPGLQALFSWRFCVIVVSWLFAALCVGQFLRQLKQGDLQWDGFVWHWAPADPASQAVHVAQMGKVSCRFDSQLCLLLKFESSLGAVQWLCLMQSFAPAHWHALRRAVYSRADSNLIPLLNSPDV